MQKSRDLFCMIVCVRKIHNSDLVFGVCTQESGLRTEVLCVKANLSVGMHALNAPNFFLLSLTNVAVR